MKLPNTFMEAEYNSFDAKQKTEALLQVFPEECIALLVRHLNSYLTYEQMKVTARLFYLLSFDGPIRSIMQPKIAEKIMELLDQLRNNIAVSIKKIISKDLITNPEIGKFLEMFVDENGIDQDDMSVLMYLAKKVTDIHLNNEEYITTANLCSYNPPENGHFYYFSKTGAQMRKVRNYSIDCKNKNYDDQPLTSKCTKVFPTVSLKGSTFLFLWFCPTHGHCYGGHIINGSEGRKDPCFSLFSYLSKAPDIIFYDFACSLEEFCLNREPKYYKNTQFFHDIFHGFSHTCSSVYSSKRIPSLNHVNTSLCEQFNSFLQCIKASGKSMSQRRFLFYVQFFINIWNERKQKSFENKLRIAAQGAA